MQQPPATPCHGAAAPVPTMPAYQRDDMPRPPRPSSPTSVPPGLDLPPSTTFREAYVPSAASAAPGIDNVPPPARVTPFSDSFRATSAADTARPSVSAPRLPPLDASEPPETPLTRSTTTTVTAFAAVPISGDRLAKYFEQYGCVTVEAISSAPGAAAGSTWTVTFESPNRAVAALCVPCSAWTVTFASPDAAVTTLAVPTFLLDRRVPVGLMPTKLFKSGWMAKPRSTLHQDSAADLSAPLFAPPTSAGPGFWGTVKSLLQ
ncbi:hypothetical protein AMAG_01183 [Allomyces macrogynus ATCC 38327]|uniref:RRM Nup35-type domain-containing protein n=1 Tax=Allomyces macrogynus (strain ATCC 38327) TaxID=578462 RepID=A0A0L0RYX3_ALLM3|nr:hypothetical protein AMAG_01183 [Allomyces macrogynus ATCC 38327]|eukprot:KNE55271.1 hypothetical protein AMAG_01183 [Allomyces macrogynus ATCC 38327]